MAMNLLKDFGNIPVKFSTLSHLLSEYQSPADKVSAMERAGELIRLKKGLYVVSEQASGKKISRELIANHLYSPSYVSCESALSYYGLIPESVYTLRSITPKRSRVFSNKLGHFDYISVADDYFYIGIQQQNIRESYAFLIASPEKALTDLIITTRKLRIQSLKAMISFLEDDIRFDTSVLSGFDTKIIEKCLLFGAKKTELKNLIKLIKS
jgi:hypothetical protein